MVVSVDERLGKLEQTCLLMNNSIKDVNAVMEKTSAIASKGARDTKIKKIKT